MTDSGTSPLLPAPDLFTVSGDATIAASTTLSQAAYAPATATSPGILDLVIISAENGSPDIRMGEFAVIQCNLAGSGTVPVPADFTLANVEIIGGNTSTAMDSLTPWVTVQPSSLSIKPN